VIQYLDSYLSGHAVVFMDIFLLILAVIGVVGVVVLRRRVEDLAIAIGFLQQKILKGRANS
jgi:hypothetical protein